MTNRLAIAIVALGLAAGARAQSPLTLSDCRISAGPGAPGIVARCGDFDRPLDP